MKLILGTWMFGDAKNNPWRTVAFGDGGFRWLPFGDTARGWDWSPISEGGRR